MIFLLYLMTCSTCISPLFCLPSEHDLDLSRLDQCHHNHHSCASGRNNIYCSCNQICTYYDDCCFDAADRTGKREEERTNEQNVHSSLLECTTCQDIVFKRRNVIRQGALMVSSCPVSWTGSNDTRYKCEQDNASDFLDILPVSDIKSNAIFTNRQCAECHGKHSYTPWLLEMTCFPDIVYKLSSSLSLTDVLMLKIQSNDCSYNYIPPIDTNVTVHYCYQDFDYEIESNPLELVNKSICQNRVFEPIQILFNNGTIEYYRNVQCLVNAYGQTYLKVLQSVFCFYISHIIGTTFSTFELRSLIDISSLLRYRQREEICREKEVYMSDKIGCRRLYCPVSSEPSGGECIDVKQTSNGIMLDLLFESNKCMDSRRNLLVKLHSVLSSLVTELKNYTYRIAIGSFWHNWNSTKIIPGIHMASGKACSIIHIHFPVRLNRDTNVTIKFLRTFVANIVSNYTKECPDGGFLKHIDDIQYASCTSNVSISNPLYVLETVSVDNDLPCPAVKVKYGGNESNSSIPIREVLGRASDEHVHFCLSGVVIAPVDIVHVNGEYFLCIDTFLLKYQPTEQQDDTFDGGVINAACQCVSIIGLLYCLVQCCVIPNGKADLLLVLIVFLLLAQTCFLVLPHLAIVENICEWLGMIHHFGWLGTFTFMFLCSYRLNNEMRDLRNYSKSEKSLATVKYTLVGIFVPLVIIISTKITNVIVAPMEKWYGGSVCFISQTYVLLFVFVVPVFLVLCGNIILFICIIRYVSATSISRNSNKCHLIIFVKISTYMGFSWVIGIVAVVLNSETLLILFEVLSNLQGLFITCSFACNNRVRKFYSECFHAKSTRLNCDS